MCYQVKILQMIWVQLVHTAILQDEELVMWTKEEISSQCLQSTGGSDLALDPLSAPSAAKDFKITIMADMLSHPFPQPPVSGAKQASHIASQIALGSIPETSRCLAKSTAYIATKCLLSITGNPRSEYGPQCIFKG